MKNILKIKVSGMATERFINICRHHKIYFNDLINTSTGFIAIMKAADFLKLKPIIKSTGVHIKIIYKKGIFFTYRKNKNRFAFVLGIIIFIVTICALSTRIWKIEFNGNLYYSKETLLEFLDKNKINLGTKTTKINEEALETLIRKEFEEIIWVSVSINGTKLIVDIKENDTKPISQKAQEPRDIIATKDGIINSIFVRTGTALVKPGDTVKEGDVLVSSKVSCTNESMEEIKIIYTKADADILIETVYEYENTINRNYEERIFTGEKIEQTVVRIGDRIITIPSKKM